MVRGHEISHGHEEMPASGSWRGGKAPETSPSSASSIAHHPRKDTGPSAQQSPT